MLLRGMNLSVPVWSMSSTAQALGLWVAKCPILRHLATSSDAAHQRGWNNDLAMSEVICGVLLSVAHEMDFVLKD
jgi:hypothetical protein